ncbi:hypothetical protein [Candidatus Palauibacter sp.]|uniref:hypothetical protein n=1 Tax=Candidatus Palauibacter sp. TaxID=3101350 RepID=UPI003AF2E93F
MPAVAVALAVAGCRAFQADISAQERPPPQEPPREPMVLLVSGGVRDGEIVLGPAFAYEGAVRLPEPPGPYRLRGLDAEGDTLFSVSLTPSETSEGGSGFAVAIPFDPAWTEALDRIELRGPGGVATLDRTDGARAMLIRDRATGQVRAILRDASGGLPPELAADSASLDIILGLPRPPARPPPRPPG